MRQKSGVSKSETGNLDKRNLRSRVIKKSQIVGTSSIKGKSCTSLSRVECPVCRIIADAIIDWRQKQSQCPGDHRRGLDVLPQDQKFRRLGNWKDFSARRQCDGCQMIVRYMERKQPQSWQKFEPTCPLILSPMIDTFWIESDAITDPHSERSFNDHPIISLVPSKRFGADLPHYITVDPVVIDFTKLRLWPSYCDENHHGSCHNVSRGVTSPPPSSITLIDMQKSCLVQIVGEMASVYVALSYVWGSIPGILELKTDNFDQLCLPGSLCKPENMSRMPRTVLDAMAASLEMGIRYLWVDRLCIIQDDSIHLHEQLQQMASIYANSYFTIIAVDGPDANYGLPGVCSRSPRSRSFNPTFFDFSAEVRMMKEPRTESFLDQLAWHTRAWTFQERILSPRALVFTGDTVYWECRSEVWYESLAAEPNGCRPSLRRNPRLSTFAFNINPWPDIAQYFGLVYSYNTRSLTFESDAQNAFTAITTTMSSSFPGGFLFGIPTFLFDIGLLWSRSLPLKRRKCFPSWSWLGWSGQVNLDLGYQSAWEPLCSLDGPFVVSDVYPLIDWRPTHEDGRAFYTIDNSYHEYKSALRRPDHPLPEGWVPQTVIYEGDEDQEKFMHRNFPEEAFNFPFPTSLPAPDPLPELSPSYLKFRTKAFTFRLGTGRVEKDETCLNIDLEDDAARWAGIVESLFTSEKEYVRGCCCEFIAISRGCAEWKEDALYQGFAEMEHADEIKYLELYEFYNVLWVETINGVTYRKAMGRVWKEALDRQATKEVDILLG